MNIIIALIICILIVYGALYTVIGWFSKSAQREFGSAVNKISTMYLQICLVAAGAFILWFFWKVEHDQVGPAQASISQPAKITDDERAWLKQFCSTRPGNSAC